MLFRHAHSRTTARRSTALLACAALAVAACGGDDDDTALDLTTTPDTTMAETTDPTTAPTEATAPETTAPDETMAPETTAPDETMAPDETDVVNETSPPTSEAAGTDCAMSESGEPLDPQALAELDAASALGQIDGASTFLFTANEADLIDRLETGEDMTLFVPTDEAFDMIPEDELQPLLSDPLQLSSLVLDHVVIGQYTSEDLEDGMTLQTATEGEQWLVNVTEDGQIMVAGSAATVVCPDIQAANAVIHLIDQVIITRGGIG